MEKYYILRCFNGAPVPDGPDVELEIAYGPFSTAEEANSVLFNVGAEFFGFRPGDDAPKDLYGCYDEKNMCFNSMNCTDREMTENMGDIFDFYFLSVAKAKV